jgi:hypothetical protein
MTVFNQDEGSDLDDLDFRVLRVVSVMHHRNIVLRRRSIPSDQWTVPEGVTSISIEAVGGGGGGGGEYSAPRVVEVAPGETLQFPIPLAVQSDTRALIEQTFDEAGELQRVIVIVHDQDMGVEILSGPFENETAMMEEYRSIREEVSDLIFDTARLLGHEARSECNHCWKPRGYRHQLHCQYSQSTSNT